MGEKEPDTVRVYLSGEDPLCLLEYEIKMLMCARLETMAACADSNTNHKRLFLEAFLLHARNLIDFLEGNDFKDNLSCKDFIDLGGEKISFIECEIEHDLKEKIHKHCHHLSKTRLTDYYGWNTKEIERKISKSFRVFYKKIGKESPIKF